MARRKGSKQLILDYFLETLAKCLSLVTSKLQAVVRWNGRDVFEN